MGYTTGTKWNIDLVREMLKEKGYILVSEEYLNTSTKLIFYDNDGYYYFKSLSDVLCSSSYKFHKSNPYTIENIKLWCKLNNKPFELMSKEYINSNKYLKWHCLKEECGEIFEANWNNIQSHWGCGFCAGKQVGVSNCLATKNSELASEWHPTLNGDLTPWDVASNTHKKIWWICKECGHEWKLSPNERKNNGCSKCNKSKGEKECNKVFVSKGMIEIDQNNYETSILDKNNITHFIPQMTFKGLFGLKGGLLSYDFYLPEYNLLIEYQGEFHDGTAYQQTKEEFEKQQEHDRRKKEYAEYNNIKLLEIWYWDFDNIEEILSKYLKIQQEQII